MNVVSLCSSLPSSPHAALPQVNLLLAALPEAECARLQPLLEWVAMPQGAALQDAGSPLRHVWFPVTAVVSLVSSMQDGASTEIALVGREGMVGICAFMGSGLAHTSAVVQAAGHGWRMPASALAQQAHDAGPGDALMLLLLRYTQTLITHMAQTSACHRHHAVDQQLCRWLLQHLDRLPGTEVVATQERIAQMLGVRREGVTVGALKLQRAGLIRYGRGRIAVLDRQGLEARSCECYAVVSQAYARLLASACALSNRPELTAPRMLAARG